MGDGYKEGCLGLIYGPEYQSRRKGYGLDPLFRVLEFGQREDHAITNAILEKVRLKGLSESRGSNGEQHKVSILHLLGPRSRFSIPWVL